MTYKLNIIGSGRLGSTIGYLLARSGHVRIAGIYNSTAQSSQKAVEFIGQGSICSHLEDLPPGDIYLITTPDQAIASVCDRLNRVVENIPPSAIFLHCSGVFSSDELQAVKNNYGCHIGSVHPLKSFADPHKSILNFSGTFCAYEGDEIACELICLLFSEIGGKLLKIDKSKKGIYHAGGVFATNYLVTLFDSALQCYLQAGIAQQTAHEIVLNMMQTTLENLKNSLPKKALTGPLQRGDITTIQRHIAELTRTQLLPLYQILGRATVELTEHSDQKKLELINSLRND